MINDIIKYINCSLKKAKKQHKETNDVILKSALVYKYLYQKHFRTCISIDGILKFNNNEIGLIGPGNGCLTWLLERILGRIGVLHSHSIMQDAFGRFYAHYSLDRGYPYVIPENITPKCIKRSPLCGQISGLIYCVSKKIII